MRIGFLTPHLKVRGANRRIIEISNWWVKKGHEVVIYHSDGSLCKWMECLAEVKAETDCVAEEQDVLVITNRKMYPIAIRAKARLRLFYVLLLYGDEERLMRYWSRCWVKLMGWKYGLYMHQMLTDKSIVKVANSTGMKRELMNLGVDSELAIGGVNPKMFRPYKNNVKRKRKVVLAVGDPLEWKGFTVTQQAMEMISRNRQDLVLETYYGQNLDQNVLAKRYSNADIFISNQFKGGWNNPVAEAMACKTAVVCSDIPSVIDIAIEGKTALKVKVNSPTETAKAIVRLADNPDLREKLTVNAYRHILQFSWERTANQLMRIIEKYIDG